MEKKYAAIYLRVSTKYQCEEGVSLEVQREETMHEAKRYNYQIFEIFTDEGVSGSFTKRDRLQDLINKIKTQNDNSEEKIDALIIYDLSRLSRSIKHTLDMFKLFDSKKIKLISIKDGLNGENDAISRKIITTVLSLLNELYVDQLRLKVPAGMKKSLIENKRWQGGQVPFGYDLTPIKNENGDYIYEKAENRKKIVKNLNINKEEADIIKIAFDKIAHEGWGAYKVVKFLNENGYKTKRNNEFRTKSLLDIIHNKLYRQFDENSKHGTLVWGKTKKEITNYENGTYKVHARAEPIVDEIEGSHEYIVNFKTWNLANYNIRQRANALNNSNNNYNFIDNNGFKKRKKTSSHLFGNILKCPSCGGNMMGNYQTRYTKKDGQIREVYYKCYNWFQSGVCQPNSLKEDNIINLIMPFFYKGFNFYYNLIPDQKDIEEIDNININSKLLNVKKDIDNVINNINKLKKQIDNLIKTSSTIIDESIKQKYFNIIMEKNEDLKKLQKKEKKLNNEIVGREHKIEEMLKLKNSDNLKVEENYISKYFFIEDKQVQINLINKILKEVVICKTAFKKYKLNKITYNYKSMMEIIAPEKNTFNEYDNIEVLQNVILNTICAKYILSDADIKELKQITNDYIYKYIFFNKLEPLDVLNNELIVYLQDLINNVENNDENAMNVLKERFDQL